MTDGTLVTVIETATAERSDSHAARFVIPVPEGRAPSELAAEIEGALARLDVVITALTPMSQRDLVLTLPQRQFTDAARAFDAAHAIERSFDLSVVEPEIFHGVMPVDPALAGPDELEAAGFPPGCWVDDD